MEKRLSYLTSAALLALIMLSSLSATPALAACGPRAGECIAPPYAVAAEPVWAVLNGVPQGNYPGGNMEFTAVVVNSAHPPNGNVTLINETVTAPAFPADSQSNYGIGLPIALAPGQLIVNTIHLPIPSNFSQGNFTANLVANVALWNGTVYIFLRLTSSTVVTLLGLPGATSSSTSQTTQTITKTVNQTGSVSSPLFAAGVAIPSLVAIILLALMVRGRGRPMGAS